MQINEHILKLTGKVSLPKELLNGNNYTLSVTGSVTSRTEEDNQDGTVNWVYKFEPVLVEILTEKGETIKAKDRRKLSQKLRGRLFLEWQEVVITGA